MLWSDTKLWICAGTWCHVLDLCKALEDSHTDTMIALNQLLSDIASSTAIIFCTLLKPITKQTYGLSRWRNNKFPMDIFNTLSHVWCNVQWILGGSLGRISITWPCWISRDKSSWILRTNACYYQTTIKSRPQDSGITPRLCQLIHAPVFIACCHSNY